MKKLTLLSGAACALLLIWSCNSSRTGVHDHSTHTETVSDHENIDPHDHEAEHEGPEHGAGHSDEIVIAPEKAEAAGIAVEKIIPSGFRGVIRTGGQILPAVGDEKMLVATSDGIVSFSGNYAAGMKVGNGEPLFSLLSGNIQDGNRIVKARIAYETAKAEYLRTSKLVDDRIVSQKDFIRIKEAYENARTAYEALKPNADGTGVQIESPFQGYIKDILVNEGDFVTTGTPLASIVKNRKFILRADVSQRYYDRLGEITSANFSTQYSETVLNTDSLGGRLLSRGKISAGSSYYTPVTFEFESRTGVIPGSFAEVWLLTSPRSNVISVPVSALTEEQGLYYVYLKIDDSCYRKQEVALGESDGRRAEIIEGVKAGDTVVTAGAMKVKLASASNIIPAHTHNH